MHHQALPVMIETPSRAKARRRTGRSGANGAVIGSVIAISEPGAATIRLADGSTFLVTRSTVELTSSDIGGDVVVVFEQQDRHKPIVIGRIQPAASSPPHASLKPIELKVDGETVRVTAERELVLECGKASITLTRAGKVLIRGAYVLSRSSGVNRIKGGSVQIN